jgi:hypothetical protein
VINTVGVAVGAGCLLRHDVVGAHLGARQASAAPPRTHDDVRAADHREATADGECAFTLLSHGRQRGPRCRHRCSLSSSVLVVIIVSPPMGYYAVASLLSPWLCESLTSM